MNKEKTLKIINDLIVEINKLSEQLDEQEHTTAKLYVDSWVIGGLKMIEKKINGGCNYYPENATYTRLFQNFINYFMCRNIKPAIKIYAIASMFSIESRDLIIRLYEQLYNSNERNVCARLIRGWGKYRDFNNFEKFDIICQSTIKHGRC